MVLIAVSLMIRYFPLQILDLMFRDCVEWWYYDLIGTNPLFLYELRQVAQHVVVAFANK